MGDSWEDEDFEIPTIAVSAKPAAAWKPDEEEEDQVVLDEKVSPTSPSPAMIESAKKKAEQEEIRLANQLKFAQLENETPEQRKIRERKQVEEADATLAGELFGGGKASSSAAGGGIVAGLGGVAMKTKQDHTNFGILCSKKMADSTSMNITAFYKSFFDSTKAKLTTESIDEILDAISKVREERRKTEPLNKKVAQAAKQKTKKEIEAEKKKHAATFGGFDDPDDPYEQFSAMEDDFM